MADATFAKYLIQNKYLFIHLIQFVYNAGTAAVKKKIVQDAENHICIAPIGVYGLTRRVAPLALNAKSKIVPIVHFDPRSITVVGGAAIQLYNINSQTTDIDFVWWPKILLPTNISKQLKQSSEFMDTIQQRSTPYYYSYSYSGVGGEKVFLNDTTKFTFADASEHAVVSSSWAIQALIQEFVKELQEHLKKYIEVFYLSLSDLAKHVYTQPTIHITSHVDYENIFIAGICNVWGYIDIQSETGDIVASIKILEITIHDGASSQKSNTLEPAISDPIFSRFQNIQGFFTPLQISVESVTAFVPRLDRLLDQQLFALQRRSDVSKIHPTILRIKELYKLLVGSYGYEYANKYIPIFQQLCTKKEYEFYVLCKNFRSPTISLVSKTAYNV